MYKVVYLPEVVDEDIPKLGAREKILIRKAIEAKLQTNPVEFGKPLQYSLKGCRRLRVADFRVIFQIENNTVTIVKIGHRREVYQC